MAHLQPLIDTELWLAHKRRALTLPVDGADFLMRRAAEDLADRLGAVERRFGKAAALFCQTSAATRVRADSGKVAEIVRVEPDDAFRAGTACSAAPAGTLPVH